MATTNVIDYGMLDEDVLQAMYDSYPDNVMYEDMDIATVIAALFWLDTHYGLHQETDRVVLRPEFLACLLPTVTVTNDERLNQIAAQMRQQFRDTSVPDVDYETTMQLASEWFKVRFIDTAEGEPVPFHPIMEGKEIYIRILTSEEAAQLEAAESLFSVATVREDGSPIILPPPSSPNIILA